MTIRFANHLSTRRTRSELRVEGVGSNTSVRTRGRVTVQLESMVDPTFGLAIEFHLLDSITSPTPVANIAASCWTHLRELGLADPTFGSTGKIDALIGADIWGTVLRDGIVRGARNEPYAQLTQLGWVVFGPAEIESPVAAAVQSLQVRISDEEPRLTELLQTFLQFEEATAPAPAPSEPDICETLFLATYSRAADGRYVVQIPFSPDAPTLGNSHPLALRQFMQLERRLASNPDLKERYVAFMREYIALGHMRVVTDQPGDPSQCFYIPHHPVTVKFRVVFNGSAQTTNGVSLNDTQLAGPTIQDTLVNIVFRFRLFAVALSADVEKMFRQIQIDERHQHWQLILWRESSHAPLCTYALTTVTYGLTSSPFNAVRALHQCAIDNCGVISDGNRAAVARTSILRDFYVDDYLTSAPSTERAVELATDVDRILQQGHFPLRKWQSNDAHALARITDTPAPLDDIELKSPETTVLGLHWDPVRDELFYKLKLDNSLSATKRQVLSDTARLYDPTGMLGPVIVKAKIFIQSLWKSGLAWDTPLPDELLAEWLAFRSGLRHLESLRIPRWFGLRPEYMPRLHGFCDASGKAYAAVIYLCSINADGERTSMLITSKTKVAPTKLGANGSSITTIPRLELCAAQLLAITMANIRPALGLDDVPYTMWTDASIVLDWLRKSPATLKPYVANRVHSIQQQSDISNWHHVRTKFNPADCASRGLTAEALVNHPLWWHGPPSLLGDEQLPADYPPLTEDEVSAMAEETKPIKANTARTVPVRTLQTHHVNGNEILTMDLIDRCSRLNQLLRITAYVFRANAKRRQYWHQDHIGHDEMNHALEWHIRNEQGMAFAAEIHIIRMRSDRESLGADTTGNQLALPTSSRILTFAPYLDDRDILRVGGRIRHAELSYDRRHPIILAKNSKLAALIIAQIHQETLHGGTQLMLQTLRQKYWVLNGRAAVKQCAHKCVICRRHSQIMTQQQMASLPASRVRAAHLFQSAGVDYCGPFSIRIGTKRTRTTMKTWVAIFVCMSTKAVHIELAENLSADAFLNVYSRFTGRRGQCHHLYSDNGTAFTGADRKMRSDLAEWHSAYTFQQLANRGTTWHFISPGAPHQGGLWEAAVKSAKRHLLRVVGTQAMLYDQLNTLLVRIEACLNSRPLIALHDSIDDRLALTPADILTGRPLVSIPEAPIPDVPLNRLQYWQRLRQMHQHFWQGWEDDYLASLQQRHKWKTQSDNLRVGDIVVIRHENLPPSQWRLGKITSVHPGSDGLVRNATILYQGREGDQLVMRECTRPVQKLCKLLLE